MDGADIGMVKGGASPGLMNETLPCQAVSEQFSRKKLESHCPFQFDILSLIDNAHAAAANLPDDLILARKQAPRAQPFRQAGVDGESSFGPTSVELENGAPHSPQNLWVSLLLVPHLGQVCGIALPFIGTDKSLKRKNAPLFPRSSLNLTVKLKINLILNMVKQKNCGQVIFF